MAPFLFTQENKSDSFPLEKLDILQSYINSYNNNWGLGFLSRTNQASIPYRFNTSYILWKNHLPQGLMDLPIIESAWDPRSLSSSGALGIWQFMENSIPSSFVQDRWRDDRMDLILSSQAAASKFIYNLQRSQNNWLLALAGYNCGINHITRSLQEHPDSDYWNLRELGILPNQTEEYIPRFLAVHYINQRKVRYAMSIHWDKSPQWVAFPLKENFFLPALADGINMDLQEILLGNRELWEWITPPEDRYYKIKIPQEKIMEYFDYLENFKEQWVINPQGLTDNANRDFPRDTQRYYIVKDGEDLWEITEQLQISLQSFMEINHLTENTPIFTGMVLFLP
ncbi:MAG: transglycosylase SLT domain-containing protein [Spirochaetaceae bacterium]|jgi:membrane-bound lytic murein transglycosylase D|nr:transglycosylase SLT domain-containing protein [Spirochaetaceae bacterium]